MIYFGVFRVILSYIIIHDLQNTVSQIQPIDWVSPRLQVLYCFRRSYMFEVCMRKLNAGHWFVLYLTTQQSMIRSF